MTLIRAVLIAYGSVAVTCLRMFLASLAIDARKKTSRHYMTAMQGFNQTGGRGYTGHPAQLVKFLSSSVSSCVKLRSVKAISLSCSQA
jgi:hypothetical protein